MLIMTNYYKITIKGNHNCTCESARECTGKEPHSRLRLHRTSLPPPPLHVHASIHVPPAQTRRCPRGQTRGRRNKARGRPGESCRRPGKKPDDAPARSVPGTTLPWSRHGLLADHRPIRFYNKGSHWAEGYKENRYTSLYTLYRDGPTTTDRLPNRETFSFGDGPTTTDRLSKRETFSFGDKWSSHGENLLKGEQTTVFFSFQATHETGTFGWEGNELDAQQSARQ